jgi:predicted nucleic acid-binding protein
VEDNNQIEKVVALDADVTIVLIQATQLDIITNLPGYSFRIPEDAYQEILLEDQKNALDAEITAGRLIVVSIDDITELQSLSEFRKTMGKGESACLTLAVHRGWLVASNDKHFTKKAKLRIDESRVLTVDKLRALAKSVGLMGKDK